MQDKSLGTIPVLIYPLSPITMSIFSAHEKAE